jgi:hypothetical protein
MKADADGFSSITAEAKQWVEEFLLIPNTIH